MNIVEKETEQDVKIDMVDIISQTYGENHRSGKLWINLFVLYIIIVYCINIYIGLCYYIFDYMLDYVLHYIHVVLGRIRNTEDQKTKSQSSHHDTTSIITPRHYNTQFNDNQPLQIRR